MRSERSFFSIGMWAALLLVVLQSGSDIALAFPPPFAIVAPVDSVPNSDVYVGTGMDSGFGVSGTANYGGVELALKVYGWGDFGYQEFRDIYSDEYLNWSTSITGVDVGSAHDDWYIELYVITPATACEGEVWTMADSVTFDVIYGDPPP